MSIVPWTIITMSSMWGELNSYRNRIEVIYLRQVVVAFLFHFFSIIFSPAQNVLPITHFSSLFWGLSKVYFICRGPIEISWGRRRGAPRRWCISESVKELVFLLWIPKGCHMRGIQSRSKRWKRVFVQLLRHQNFQNQKYMAASYLNNNVQENSLINYFKRIMIWKNLRHFFAL